MKVLVLGGCGVQGRTAVYDLARSPEVEEVICADVNLDGLDLIRDFTEMSKVRPEVLDVGDRAALLDLLRRADVSVDMLPRHFLVEVTEAAIEAGVGMVNSNYAYPILDLNDAAREAGVAIMPECGLDPGIDLVIYGRARDFFETLTVVNSYCGGLPEKAAADNPLGYKVSWTWEGVLASTKRPSRAVIDGEVVDISAAEQHESDLVHEIEFPGLGTLEAIPNGDAVFFTDLMGATGTIRETGRYSLRRPGWSAFWRPLKRLGFLGDEPVPGLPCEVTPYEFMTRLLEPQLQYGRNEKDLVVMVNVFEGLRDGRPARLTVRLLIERDLDTGLMAMSKGVGYPAAIAARMIASGRIEAKGVLSPTRDIPYEPFFEELAQRGVILEETVEELN